MAMKLISISYLFIGIFSVIFFKSGSCTKCWECVNTANIEECLDSGNLISCQDSEVCSTEVRKDIDNIRIWKGCKQRKACENQRLQNWERAPYTCNNDQPNSHCWCCCDSDSCNVNETCEVTARECPMPSLQFNHGLINCSNSNHLGSLCSYQCTEKDYHEKPLNKQNRLCLGNGKWSENKPCCVRPCPPYVPLDLVGVGHFTNEENLKSRFGGLAPLFGNLARGKDYFQLYLVYFDEEVYHVQLPEDTTVIGPYRQLANNTVNSGAALRHVYNNILGRMRRRGSQSDIILLAVEKESDDDVVSAAAALKREGVTIVYAFYQLAGHKVNMDEARAVATSEDHIIVVGGEKEVDFLQMFKNYFALACDYPCPNSDEN